jgi:hypothetical protein
MVIGGSVGCLALGSPGYIGPGYPLLAMYDGIWPLDATAVFT